MAKHNMEWLRDKTENQLDELYMQYNTIISKVRGQAKNNRLEGGAKLREYNEAVRNRARILTLLNQRRHETMMRNGIPGR